MGIIKEAVSGTVLVASAQFLLMFALSRQTPFVGQIRTI